MAKKCLECGTELTSTNEIIFHTCEAYPKQKDEGSWLEILLKNKEKEGN